jgi:hypothetical protein
MNSQGQKDEADSPLSASVRESENEDIDEEPYNYPNKKTNIIGKQDLISPLHHLESSSYDYYEDEEEEE